MTLRVQVLTDTGEDRGSRYFAVMPRKGERVMLGFGQIGLVLDVLHGDPLTITVKVLGQRNKEGQR